MTQKEFEERTGLTMTAQEYVAVENTYMAIGDDIDKDRFCKIWLDKKQLAEIMTSRAIEYRRQKEQAQEARRKVENDLADFLIEQAEKWGAGDLRLKAIEMLGAREYLRRKIEKDYNLWEDDRKMLVNILTGTNE